MSASAYYLACDFPESTTGGLFKNDGITRFVEASRSLACRNAGNVRLPVGSAPEAACL